MKTTTRAALAAVMAAALGLPSCSEDDAGGSKPADGSAAAGGSAATGGAAGSGGSTNDDASVDASGGSSAAGSAGSAGSAGNAGNAGNGNADFAARCAAPGVVLCRGFDSESDLALGEIGNAADGTQQAFLDTGVKASGGGSLGFKFRAGVSAQNIGGFWSTPMGKSFGSGDTLHVQYRWRATPSYFQNNEAHWKSSIKQLNIHGPSKTCQDSEFATVLYHRYISMYTACGEGWFTDVNTNERIPSCPGDCLHEQGASTTPSPNGSGYNCHHQNQFAGDGTGSGCFFPPPDTWITHYEVIQLGTFGGSDSSVNAFEAHAGSGYKQWQRVNGVTWHDGDDDHLSVLRFETYMTEIEGPAPVDATIWYDELIVSTEPIAAPL